MSNPSASLGYVILFVKDVAASLLFYESVFGLPRRFFHDDNGKAYGELETGATRLAFVSHAQVASHLKGDFVAAAPDKPPLGVEIAMTTADVAGVYAKALAAGAAAVKEPSSMPWGQLVAYIRDNSGHLVEICTPMR